MWTMCLTTWGLFLCVHLYALPLGEEVRTAEQTMTERTAAQPQGGREWGFYVIADLKTWATNAEQQSPIEHFATF